MAQVVLRNSWYAPDGRFYQSNFPGPSEVPDQLVRFLPTTAVVYSGSHTPPSPNRPVMAHLIREQETFDADAYAKSVEAPTPAVAEVPVVAEPAIQEADVQPVAEEAPAAEVDPIEAEQRRLEAEEAAAAAAKDEKPATAARPKRR